MYGKGPINDPNSIIESIAESYVLMCNFEVVVAESDSKGVNNVVHLK